MAKYTFFGQPDGVAGLAPSVSCTIIGLWTACDRRDEEGDVDPASTVRNQHHVATGFFQCDTYRSEQVDLVKVPLVATVLYFCKLLTIVLLSMSMCSFVGPSSVDDPRRVIAFNCLPAYLGLGAI